MNMNIERNTVKNYHMKLNEKLNKEENECTVKVEVSKDFLNNLDKIIESMIMDDDSWKDMVKRTDTPKFIYSDECASSRLAYENAKLKAKINDLERKLDIANTMGGMLLKHNFRLMQECRDAGHGEIVDKFLDELRKELEK